MTPVIRGTTGFANNKGVQIWYESLAANATHATTERKPILFIMGIATDGLGWENVFLDYLIAEGYPVIRIDNRDVGMSDWVDYTQNPYTLSDMAGDAVAVLDHLGIEKAHICGVSMGGMIAQIVALEHPERVASLIPIMSSAWVLAPFGFHWRSIQTLWRMFSSIAAARKNPTPETILQLQYKMYSIMLGMRCTDVIPYDIIKANFECNYYDRKKYNPRAFLHQFRAIWASGSRKAILKNLNAYTYYTRHT